MPNESGTWIMYGPDRDDPSCLNSVEQAADFINKAGFLPLFKNDIPGFSLEEHTAPEYWWSEDCDHDPWEWREIIARRGDIAYGKFFDKKAGFISREWFPYFANYRRDGYDFDALWEDGKAPSRQKKIMDLYGEEHMDALYLSSELKKLAGFGKGGEKGFDGIVTGLQMQTYLCIRDFRRRRNKREEEYGWPVAVYVMPEQLWGYDFVTSAYEEEPDASAGRIARQIQELYPQAEEEQIRDVIGLKPGERKVTVRKKRQER